LPLKRLEDAPGSGLFSRFVPIESLRVGRLEARSPAELATYRYVCGAALHINEEFFPVKSSPQISHRWRMDFISFRKEKNPKVYTNVDIRTSRIL
jgi:hypothetical protein